MRLPIGIIGGVGFNLWDREDEMKSTETGRATTTEIDHRHLCGVCGGVWRHADVECEGPRYTQEWSLRVTPKFDCPACVDDSGVA